MAKITAKQVKELRDRTGAGMMDAKNALVEVDGDIDKAIDYLRENGLAKAAKKADRIAAEGLAATAVTADAAAIVEVNAETDFVAKNEQFINVVNTIAQAIVENKPANMEEALEIQVDGDTLDNFVKNATSVIGEKISFRRFAVVDINEGEHVGAYTHAGGSIVALAKVKGASDEVARDIAMHGAAMNPKYIGEADVPADVVEREKSVLTEQSLNEGKPAHIVEKMVEGRMKKFFAEICLVDQDFIKDGDVTVGQYVKNNDGELVDYIRYEVGEGIEKREENFAEEVRNQMNQ